MSVPCLGILSLLLFFGAKLANTAESEVCWAICYIIVNNLKNLGEQGWGREDDEAFKQNRLLPCLHEKKRGHNML